MQVFPADAAHGLGSATPPASLTLPTTTLAALGFPSFSKANPTITLVVGDNNFVDNGGQFALAQAAASSPVPTLGEWGLLALALLPAGLGVAFVRRR